MSASRRVTQKTTKPLLGITMGDPAGIGPEVIAKALASGAIRKHGRPLIIGSLPVMAQTIRSLHLPLRAIPVQDHEGLPVSRTDIPVLDPLMRPLGAFTLGRVSKKTGAASVQFIEKAVDLAQAGCIDAMVTAPINKEAMHLAGYSYPGHTEMLAALTKSRESGMMIVGGPLRIMFVTTHLALRDLSRKLSIGNIERAIRLAHVALQQFYGIHRPKIGVAALNPHASDGGLFGDEEKRLIHPAVVNARKRGIVATSPQPADTLFGKAVRGEFDAVVAMYHDQGLIPLKLVAFGTCVNLTVGLPILRTSVDHGTAFDIAGKGVADPGSLLEAIKLAGQLAQRRKKSLYRSVQRRKK